MRKTKAQLELRLATAVSNNKKCFHKCINNKKKAKENLPPLLDADRGTFSLGMRKRLRYSMPSLPQSLVVIPGIPRVFIPLSWKTGTESRINPP